MELYTLGSQYYNGYILPMSVTNDLNALDYITAKDYYKIIFIESGTCHIILNREKYILTGAHIICLNEEDKIEFYKISDNTISILFFKPTVINAKFNIDSLNNINGTFTMSEYQDVYFLMQFKHNAKIDNKILSLRGIDSSVIGLKIGQIYELLTNQTISFWPCRSRSYLYEILFSLVRDEKYIDENCTVQIKTNFSELTVETIYYLQTCYNQKITVERLTEEFHTNRTTLLSDFKKSTGQSINHYLMQLRMTMASTLLRDTELSIDEICERTGFREISYFSKVFKKCIQHTPSEYRRICK